MRIAAGVMAAAALILGVAAPAASAHTASHIARTASAPRTVHITTPGLDCTATWSGPNASMTCTGTGTWQMDIYCNFPSPSPIQNGWITQVNTTRTSAGSCWFMAGVQKVTIEVGGPSASHGSAAQHPATARHAQPATQGLDCTQRRQIAGPNADTTCTGTGTWQMDIYCTFPSPSPIRNGWVTQVNTTRTSAGSCWFFSYTTDVTIEYAV